MALDHLGVIAARIRSSMLKLKEGPEGDGFIGLKPLDEVLPPPYIQTAYLSLYRSCLARALNISND